MRYQYCLNEAPRSKTSLNINSKKPKVTVLGTSMVRGSGPELAKCLGTKNTMVYSISGLSLESAAAKSNDIFKDHRQGDVAAIQIGTADLLTHNVSQLESKYSDLLSIIKSSAPECKLIINAVPRRLPPVLGLAWLIREQINLMISFVEDVPWTSSLFSWIPILCCQLHIMKKMVSISMDPDLTISPNFYAAT